MIIEGHLTGHSRGLNEPTFERIVTIRSDNGERDAKKWSESFACVSVRSGPSADPLFHIASK